MSATGRTLPKASCNRTSLCTAPEARAGRPRRLPPGRDRSVHPVQHATRSRAGSIDLGVSSPRTSSARWPRRLLAGPAVARSASICASIRGSATRARWARIDVAVEAPAAEICRPPMPNWTVGPGAMRRISAAARSPRGAQSGKLSAADRSALNRALAKALAFRDAGRVPEALPFVGAPTGSLAQVRVRVRRSHERGSWSSGTANSITSGSLHARLLPLASAAAPPARPPAPWRAW